MRLKILGKCFVVGYVFDPRAQHLEIGYIMRYVIVVTKKRQCLVVE